MQMPQTARKNIALAAIILAALYLFAPTTGIVGGLLDYQVYGFITPKNITAAILGITAWWVWKGGYI